MSYVWNAIFFVTGIAAGAALISFGLAHNSIEIDLPARNATAICTIFPK